MTAAIEVKGLHTVLGGNVVHRDLDLVIEGRRVLAIVGGSGSGKTTLLRLMLGLMTPQAGEVRVLGHPLGACAKRDLEQVQHRARRAVPAGRAVLGALGVRQRRLAAARAEGLLRATSCARW
jgi:phospholipid/cholesterol/gamma-HCH transport system ATP-binding protein